MTEREDPSYDETEPTNDEATPHTADDESIEQIPQQPEALTLPDLPQPSELGFSQERLEISDEVLRRSQEYLDWLFPDNAPNLQELASEGKIAGFTEEERRRNIEGGYTLEIITPDTSEEEIAAAWDSAKKKIELWSRDQIEIEIDPFTSKTRLITRRSPAWFKVIAIKPNAEVLIAHPETKRKNPEQLTSILEEAQRYNPLLQGIDLSGYLLLDAYFVYHADIHLNEHRAVEEYLLSERVLDSPRYRFSPSVKECLLSERIPDTGRCSCVRWCSPNHTLRVVSYTLGSSSRGARFVAESQPDRFLLPTFGSQHERKEALLKINRVFGKKITSHLPNTDSWARNYLLLTRADEGGRCALDQVEEYLDQYGDTDERQRQQLAAAQKYFPGEFLVRPASAPQEEGRGSLVSPVSPDKLENIDTSKLVRPVEGPSAVETATDDPESEEK